jgi:putative holliday junction resolvase
MNARTYLAFDFGERRIGVAVGNDVTESSTALTTIDATNDELRFSAITPLVNEWAPHAFVVGHPTHASGDAHAMTERAERFARQLQGRYRRAAHLIDERYSSVDAVEALTRRGVAGQHQKKHIDSQAAAIILARFFEAGHHKTTSTPEPS